MDRKYSDPNIWDNSINWDDAPDGSDGGYTSHGSRIHPSAMRELVRLRAEIAECRSALAKVGPYYIPATSVSDEEAAEVYAAIWNAARKGEEKP